MLAARAHIVLHILHIPHIQHSTYCIAHTAQTSLPISHSPTDAHPVRSSHPCSQLTPTPPLSRCQTSIDLISGKPAGVLLLLDEASRLQGAKETAFFEQVNEKNKKSKAYKMPAKKRPTEAFEIKHYAGHVVYNCSSGNSATWLDKNQYTLPEEVEEVLLQSPLSEFFPPPKVPSVLC